MFCVSSDGSEPVYWFSGGLIYHAPGSSGADFPTLAVEIDPVNYPHWSVHT